MSNGNQQNHFDLLVIGGGSGGISCARRARQYGAKVALVEATSTLGGTCVNVGCVPKKVMFNCASINEMLHDVRHYGYEVKDYSFDWRTIKEARDAYIKRLNGIYLTNLEKAGVTLITGYAAFVGLNTIQVEDVEYTADHIVIAVGGAPTMPDDVDGIELCINSDGFFAIEEQPERVAVVGAGYIAVELAGIFNTLGTNTHLFTRGPKVLKKFDPLVVDALTVEMKRSGIHLHPNSSIKSVSQDAVTGKYVIETASGTKHDSYDVVLMAVGRHPTLAPLNLEAVNVKLNDTGHIATDEYENTSVAGIYALGDVNGKIELTPMAIAAGRRLADRLFGGMPTAKAFYENVPTVVFSHPPLATIGLTQPEAEQQYGADTLKIYTSTFTNLYYGPMAIPSEDKEKTCIKLVCHGDDQKVIGLHILGKGADECMQGFGVAIRMGATKADLDNCIAIHPTMSEELTTLAPWGLKNNPTPAAAGTKTTKQQQDSKS